MTTAESTPQEQCSTGIQGAPAWYTEEQIVRAVPAERARRLLEATLRSGFRPEDDPARSNVPAGEGHLRVSLASADEVLVEGLRRVVAALRERPSGAVPHH